MATGRMLKKNISTSRKLSELKSDSARLLYTWLLPHLDIEGRFSANPYVVKGYIVPRLTTMTPEKIEEFLHELSQKKLIILYEVNEDKYLEFTKFSDFQSLREDREAKSDIPNPKMANNNTNEPTPAELPQNSRRTPAKDKISKDKISKDKIICETSSPVNQDKLTKAEINTIIEYFISSLKNKRDIDYIPSWGKDTKILKSALDTIRTTPALAAVLPPTTIEQAKVLIDYYLTMDKSVKNDATFSACFSNHTQNSYIQKNRKTNNEYE